MISTVDSNKLQVWKYIRYSIGFARLSPANINNAYDHSLFSPCICRTATLLYSLYSAQSCQAQTTNPHIFSFQLANVPTHLCSPALTVTSVLIITTWTIAPLCYPFVIRKIGAIDRTWFSPHWNPPKQFKMSSPKRRIETDVGDSVHCWECESKYLSFNARQLTWCTGFFSLQVMKWVLRPSVGFEEQLLTPYPGCT